MQPEFCRVTSDPYFDDLIELLRDNIYFFSYSKGGKRDNIFRCLQIMIFFPHLVGKTTVALQVLIIFPQ